MIRKSFSLMLVCAVVLLIPSCGHEQQLVGITIQPAVQTFGSPTTPVIANAGSNVQLRALGSYIHPPVTKDITSQVAWASNTPDMVTVDPAGLLTATGQSCGGALVSATVTTNNNGAVSSSGAIVTGYMTANVVCGGGLFLSVTFLGNGTGIVTSSPLGLSCASSCASSGFAAGTTVTLTATPNSGSTFGGWTGCDSTSGPTCTVLLNASRSVGVTFN
jgi:Divergent InlB B-repeat domain